jgi:hypothetical protein
LKAAADLGHSDAQSVCPAAAPLGRCERRTSPR